MRRLLILVGLALSALSSAQTWTQVVSDSFTNANTSTGAAGSTTGVPTPATSNPWTDINGSVANIASDQLVMTSDSSSNAAQRDYLLRPTAESYHNARIVLTLPASGEGASHTQITGVLRYQSNGNSYSFIYAPSLNGAYIFKNVSGAGTQLVTQGSLTAYNSSHTYTIDCSAYGTTLKVVVTDTTASSQLCSITATDSTYTGSGRMGVAVGSDNGTSGTFKAYYSNATTYQDDPLTSYTPTATATEGNIVSSVSWFGGTPTYTVKWYRGTTPTFTINSSSLVATHSSATSPDTYSDSSATTGTQYWYAAETLDSASGDVTSAAVMGVQKNPSWRIVWIGDSNVYGDYTGSPGGSTAPPAQLADYLISLDGNRSIQVGNSGVDGSTSSDWTNPSTNLTNAEAQMNGLTGTVTIFIVCLGTNDSKSTLANTGATYKSNLESLITKLRTDYSGCYVCLTSPIYVSANTTYSGPVYYNAASQNLILSSYLPVLQAIPADYDSHVFVGDLTAWNLFADQTANWYGSQNWNGDTFYLHTNAIGATQWAMMVGVALLRGMGVAAPGPAGSPVIGG